MEYQCHLISISQLIATPAGFITPLCDKCEIKDCDNPIEKVKISILGVMKEMKVFNVGNEPKIVVQCEGYLL